MSADREIDIKIKTSADTKGAEQTSKSLEDVRQSAKEASQASQNITPGATPGNDAILQQIGELNRAADKQTEALAATSYEGEKLIRSLEGQASAVTKARLNYAAYTGALGDAHVANMNLQDGAASTGEVFDEIYGDLVRLAEGYRNGTVSAQEAQAAISQYNADIEAQKASVAECQAALSQMREVQQGINTALANKEAENEKKQAIAEINAEYASLKESVASQITIIEEEKAAAQGQIEQAEKILSNTERGTEAYRLYGQRLATLKNRLTNLHAAQDKQLAKLHGLKSKVDDLKDSYDGTSVGIQAFRESMREVGAEVENIGVQTNKLKTRYEACQTAQDVMYKAQRVLTVQLNSLIGSLMRGQISARTFATAARGIGASLYTALGPIGLVLGAIALLVEGLKALWGWWKKSGEEAAEAAKKQAEALGKQREAARKAQEAYEELKKKQSYDERVERIARDRATAERRVKEQLTESTNELREQLRLMLRMQDDETRAREAEFDLREERLREQAAREDWAPEKLDSALRQLEYERVIAKLDAEALKNAEKQKTAAAELNEILHARLGLEERLSSVDWQLGTDNTEESRTLAAKLERYLAAAETRRKAEGVDTSIIEDIFSRWNKKESGWWGFLNNISDDDEDKLVTALNLGGHNVNRRMLHSNPTQVIGAFKTYMAKLEQSKKYYNEENPDEMNALLERLGFSDVVEDIMNNREVKHSSKLVEAVKKLVEEQKDLKSKDKEFDAQNKQREKELDELTHEQTVNERARETQASLHTSRGQRIRAEAERAERERQEERKKKELDALTDKEIAMRKKALQKKLKETPIEEQSQRGKTQSELDALEKELKRRKKEGGRASTKEGKAQDKVAGEIYKLLDALEEELKSGKIDPKTAKTEREKIRMLARIIRDGKISGKKGTDGKSEIDLVKEILSSLERNTGVGDKVFSTSRELTRALQTYSQTAANDRKSIELAMTEATRAYEEAKKAYQESASLRQKLAQQMKGKHR